MRTKLILSVLFTIVVSMFGGVAIGAALGIAPLAAAGSLFGLSALPGVEGMRVGVLKEIWTGELINKFRHDKSWLSEVPRRDEFVNNDVIHMVDVGADPDVLINNTTYPIAIASRTDTDVAISLDKFDTKNTRITRDELYAISYDKQASVIETHKLALEDTTADKAAHSLAPSVNTTDTPLVLTTGGDNGATRRRLLPADVISMKKKMDDLKVPKIGRILVLCNDHIEDLLRVDEVFVNQYKNIAAGQVLNLYGFKIYEYGANAVYSKVATVVTKKAFGAASGATDQNASFCFYNQRAFQAVGSADMFYKDATINPEYRESVVGFRLHHVCLPKKWVGFGAIVSDIYSA